MLVDRYDREGSEHLLRCYTLQILSNNLVPKFQVFFKDVFPYSLSTVTFDATDTDIEYFTAEVSFKYTMYNIVDMSKQSLMIDLDALQGMWEKDSKIDMRQPLHEESLGYSHLSMRSILKCTTPSF